LRMAGKMADCGGMMAEVRRNDWLSWILVAKVPDY